MIVFVAEDVLRPKCRELVLRAIQPSTCPDCVWRGLMAIGGGRDQRSRLQW